MINMMIIIFNLILTQIFIFPEEEHGTWTKENEEKKKKRLRMQE